MKARLLRYRGPSTRNFGAGPTPTPQQGAGSTLSPFGNFVVVRGTTPRKAPIAVLTSQNLKPSPQARGKKKPYLPLTATGSGETPKTTTPTLYMAYGGKSVGLSASWHGLLLALGRGEHAANPATLPKLLLQHRCVSTGVALHLPEGPCIP